MAANPPPLAERLDIHKSCKSIENLLAVFNDYCEAAGAIVTLQKKLAKALRETAGMKATTEIAANALNSSANIFESLNEVDAKFAKIADKEYDAISSEVKKWFKKLAKEEKTHDEKISAANAKIKQAGQLYERKSKKSPREANDEHARYINLISAMGPEISQEKYNHSLLVTQRHTSTMYNLAACVSRIADAEWTKTCEGVRRFSPTIGKLGEWRALCEGGWTGPIPQDLPDIDYPQQESPEPDHPMPTRRFEDDERYTQATLRNLPPGPDHFLEHPGMNTGTSTPTHERDQPELSSPQRQPQSANDTLNRDKAPPTSFNFPGKFVDDNTGSVRSLSAFPAPPTHFPLPQTLTKRQQQQQPSQSATSSSSASHISFPALARPDRDRQSPVSETAEDSLPSRKASTAPSSPVQKKFIDNPQPVQTIEETRDATSNGGSPDQSRLKETLDPTTYRSPEPMKTSTSDQTPSSSKTFIRGDYITEEPESMAGIGSGNRNRSSYDGGRPRGLERSDTNTSNGSVVAQMRNRYTNNSGSSSPPPPREMPRLPTSVNNLASKYDRPTSPGGSRPLPSIDTQARQVEPLAYRERETASPIGTTANPTMSTSPPNTTATSGDEDFVNARRRRLEQKAAELELREKEHELRRREQEIEQRARDLERDRALLRTDANATPVANPNAATIRPRERQLSFQQDQLRRPMSGNPQMEPSPSSANSPVSPSNRGVVRPHSQYSASATHLVPPAASTRSPYRGIDEDSEYRRPGSSSSRDPSVTSTTSISASNSPVMSSLSPPSATREKKGWMRRLSMPIVAGNPFTDSKKHSSNHSYGGKGGLLSLDSRKNGSTTAFSKGDMIGEDGRMVGGARRYDIGSGISNRSVTNFNDRR
ncbi:hypothetical protein VNI00_005048 [Paramarasmius palmivorus]|uniref:Uncharacterized protein n=1 Tax=Paramarasmius palmivorus TaxID=297713 RepID=A0AAW0DEI6_9AGAR